VADSAMQDQPVWPSNRKITQFFCPSFSFMRIYERFPIRSCKFPTGCKGVSRLGYPWILWIPPPIRVCYKGCIAWDWVPISPYSGRVQHHPPTYHNPILMILLLNLTLTILTPTIPSPVHPIPFSQPTNNPSFTPTPPNN
jgi:hypothetical protein